MTFPRQSEPLPVPAAPRDVIVPGGTPPGRDISAVSFLNVLLRYRWPIIIATLAFGLYAGLGSIRSAKGYTSTASFMPKGARGQGQLGGLAAQFGISLGGGDAANSPQLYMDLLTTRTLLWPVAQKTYRVTRDTGVVEGDILRIYNIRGSPDQRRVRAIGALKGAIKTTVEPKTGVIQLRVTTGSPELSLQLANNLLEQLNIYNIATRQASAAAERSFIEQQLEARGAELRRAESVLGSFLETNRQYRSSPQLTIEYGRLQREVDRLNAGYTAMLSAFQNARIEEMRDLPVLTVLETPELPIGPNARGGVRKTAIAMLIGFVLACLAALLRDRFARTRASGSDEAMEFAALKREALGDLIRPWRPITRVIESRRRA